MKLTHIVSAVLAAAAGVIARDSAVAPAIQHTYFESALSKLLYFKNPTYLLGLDRTTGTVYHSSTYGSHWDAVKAIPGGKASRMYAHPFEPKVAYVLSDGTEHWVTHDEGKNWVAFSTPLPPTNSGERALSFHAQRTRWVLFIGEQCKEETVGWWPFPRLVCHDEAFYTRDGFEQAIKDHKSGDRTGQAVTPLLGSDRAVAKCLWARHTPEFETMAEEAIFCMEIVAASKQSSAEKRSLNPKSPAPWLTNATQPSKIYWSSTHLMQRSLADDLESILDGITRPTTTRLIFSEDFFATQNEVHFGSGNDGTSGDRAGGGVVAVSVVKDYILAAISHAHSDEMDLFVSQNGHEWAESHLPLPPGTREDAYTILESTKYAIFVDVMSSASSIAGSLYRSNSNGTYYTQSLEHTHRTSDGTVDVERVHGIEGVVIANQISNWDQAQHGDVLGRHQLELRSRISFDDGAHWRFLRAPEVDVDGRKYRCSETAWQSGECALHIHSVTSTHTPGRVFGTAAAPGIILAVGNVGSKLKEWTECDTFMSRDGGITWAAAHKGAHHVQIADAGAALILASYQATREIKYSVDGGQKWLTAELKDPIRVTSLVIDDDGLSPTVLIAGSVREGPQAHEQALIAVDFSGVWKRQCNYNANDPQPTDDMEQFVLNIRTDSDCIMGHRSEYVRRKPDATCALRLDRVLVPQQTDCKCTEHDFECDYNYERDDSGKCQLIGNEVVPKGQCKHEGDRFMASSGYRLIPGNTCIRTDNDPDRPVERPCPRVDHGSDGKNKELGKVTHHTLRVKGDPHIMAFANSTAYLMMTSEQQLYRTDSEGAEWAEVDLAASTRDSKIGKPVYLTEHPYDSQRAFIYTDNDALVFTNDRGVSWTRVRKLPTRANELHIRPLLDFSAADPNWLLFVGGTGCPGCHTEVYVSQDNGDKWSKLVTHATQCEFARTREFDALPAEAIVCAVVRGKGEQDEQRTDQSVDVHVFTKPFHDRTHHTIKPPEDCSINQFHMYGRFLVFSTTCGRELRLGVSDDGLNMHLARMPPGVQLHAQAFTLLAGDGVVLVDVAAGSGSSWGTLLASNSNGTHFRRILQHTNRAATGAVDVSRVAGLRNMLIANHVANADALDAGAHKRLRTVASWDDGRSWHALLPPPESDCTDCSIHAIGRSAGARFGADAAPGVMVAVGSVGAHLDGITRSHTYLSRDGGVSWKDVRKGISLHAIADHGALVVLVDDTTPTDVLTYTADGGLTWNTYRFADTPVIVDNLAAGPNGGGQRVLVRARPLPRTEADAESTLLITVDFSQLHSRQCVLDDHDHTRSDFELWTPRWGTSRSDAPMCVLGAETAYWRRTPTAQCFVGDEFKPVRTRTRTCECSLADFECDEGFWRNDYGECVLDGPDPQQPQGCTDGSAYEGRSGYRRMPQTQCVGGTDLTAPVQRVCGRSGGVLAHAHAPEAAVSDLQFFKDSAHVLARTDAGTVLVSLDEGAKWTALPAPDSSSKNVAANVPTIFTSIEMHPYFADYAYFVPRSGAVALYTDDAAQSTRLLHLPAPPARAVSDPLRFHPEYPDWLILLVQHDSQCTHIDSGRCRLEAYVTRDHGSSWSQLLSDPLATAGCVFLRTNRAHKPHRQTIACARHFDTGGDVMVSDNWFRTRETLVPHATDFAQAGEFFLVSQSANDGRALSLFVSADGRTAAQAQFPGDRNTTGPAFTVLEPSVGLSYLDTMGRTHTTPGGTPMLHVTNNTTPGAEWGTLYTADSDGVLYRRALEFVNRDETGLVDFERIRAIEGGALANVVANPAQTQAGAAKQLQTMVTVDGGARWHYLRLATSTKCRQTAPHSGDCALHLHGYTEVSDPENIYSASGAVGLVMGIGNVGTHLGHIGQADTYLSDDGGTTWSMVRRGPMWHKFGDHGALIVVAERLHPTSSVEYSLDRGRTWLTLPLPKEAHSIRVELLLTPPDATSRRFVLYGRVSGRSMLVSLDFTGAQPRTCVFNEDASKGDFERFAPQMVSPAHGDLCLLGRRTEYFRRKPTALCYVGDEFSPVRLLTHICECTEYDYECNYNFVRKPTQDGSLGKCVLIEGMRPPRTNCTEGGSDYFKIEAAYRKIPQSICRNGLQLDRPTEVWCPGKARSVAILWSVLLPVVFLGLAYLGYKRWRDQYPYLRLEDIGTVVRPALHNLRHPPGPQAGWVQQVQPVFTSALSTAGAIGGAVKESFLWTLDKAAPYLPSSIQRWSYEHPPRWGAIPSLDGRSRRNIRRTDGERSRFTYQPLTTSEAAARIFGSYEDTQALEFSDHNDDLDEYDEVEAGFNHFLEEEERLENEGEADAQVVDRQVLFANAELSDEEN